MLHIYSLELQRVGAGSAEPVAQKMLDLSGPSIDHTALARGFGVDACRVSSADELVSALLRTYDEPGPHLIEAIVPALF